MDVPLSNRWKATGTKGTELVKAIVHRIATIVTCSERMVSIGQANSERRKRFEPLPTLRSSSGLSIKQQGVFCKIYSGVGGQGESIVKNRPSLKILKFK